MKKIKTLSILSLCNLITLFSASQCFASEEEGFLWASLLPGWKYLTSFEHHTAKMCDFGNLNAGAIVHALMVSILLIGLCVYIRRKSPPKVIPSSKVTLGNVLEAVIEFIVDLIEDNIGRSGRRFIPLIGALFTFILVGNLMGLIPGFLPPTDNININAGCAIIVFILYQAAGVKEHGLSYLKHFAGPIWWLAPFMFVIELIGHVARPFSLSIRLFGNIMGDHKVLELFSNLVPLGVPVFNLALGTFVSIIQALVFSLLTAIYISMAVEPGEH